MSAKRRLPEIRLLPTSLKSSRILVVFCILLATLAIVGYNIYTSFGKLASHTQRIPFNAGHILRQCAALHAVPGPPDDFSEREESDRYEAGTGATLIRNATIWTGEMNGTEANIVYGDVLLDRGLVKNVGEVPQIRISKAFNLTVVNADGAWVTPGLVDLHSHLGVFSAPALAGASDDNSPNGPILPWLRSIDALNTHDDAFQLAISGGVTSVQVLPGSANAIGGQAFMVKLRKTRERSPSAMIIEPPHTLNGSEVDPALPPRWRHLKQACGENLNQYGTRMDSIWAFRSAYAEARKIKEAQDALCQNAVAGQWNAVHGDFPESLKWEMLVDVLRGRVKISTHCYEAVDLDDIVRLTNEFKFPIASFHHASEAWLVPDLLKRTWGGTPTIAIFSTNHRYKREAYRGSEFAARVLADNGIPVVMKSDHPVINSRYLMHEAQKVHHYGLPPHLALSSVTSVPATAAGLAHRIGILTPGADADVVLWDSHPLQLGATPMNVWIDGVQQIPLPSKVAGKNEEVVVGKAKRGLEWGRVPEVPNWDDERAKAIEWEGLPPLDASPERGKVIFHNVTEVWTKGADGTIEETFPARSTTGDKEVGVVVVEKGKIVCAGPAKECLPDSDLETHNNVDLHGGSISPGFMSFGSPLGLEEIPAEPSTADGPLYNPFVSDVPAILGDVGGVVRAVDALKFRTRDALTAYRSGITLATSSLSQSFLPTGSDRVISGLSATFRTGSKHALDKGALVQEVTALHVAVGRSSVIGRVSVSEQVAVLRRLLLGWENKDTQTGYWFKKASEGVVPLVVEVGSADIMTTLLILKHEVEEMKGSVMRMVFSGAAEAHLLAEEISKAQVGVILNPARPYPWTWDDRRILPGPPLSNDTALVVLLAHNVAVGLGVREANEARNARFDVAWAAIESNGRIDRRQAHELASTRLENMLKIWGVGDEPDLVAYDGGSALDLSSKVAAVLSPQRGLVDLM